jgi:deoxyribonuclease-4
MPALFGPGGNSDSFAAEGYKHTYQAPKWLAERGLGAYEYQGGNGIFGSDATFARIGEEARKYGIAMSLHTPYYISLSGVEEDKRLASIGHIKKSLNAAKLMGADIIVIHSGSASKISREEAMYLASDTLYRALEETAGEYDDIRLGIETMGKRNQLGTLDEVITLCKLDDRLWPVVDFGHMYARETGTIFGEADRDGYMRVFDKIACNLDDEKATGLHCHFSRIEYTGAGEKKHVTFAQNGGFGPDYRPLIEVIVREGLSPRIICESAGTMAEDAREMQDYYTLLLTG